MNRYADLQNSLRDLAEHRRADTSLALKAIDAIDELVNEVERANARADAMQAEAAARPGASLKAALVAIVDQETERANATVKRMARIARTALEGS